LFFSNLINHQIWYLQILDIHLHRQTNINMTNTYTTYEHLDLRVNDLFLNEEHSEDLKDIVSRNMLIK